MVMTVQRKLLSLFNLLARSQFANGKRIVTIERKVLGLKQLRAPQQCRFLPTGVDFSQHCVILSTLPGHHARDRPILSVTEQAPNRKAHHDLPLMSRLR